MFLPLVLDKAGVSVQWSHNPLQHLYALYIIPDCDCTQLQLSSALHLEEDQSILVKTFLASSLAGIESGTVSCRFYCQSFPQFSATGTKYHMHWKIYIQYCMVFTCGALLWLYYYCTVFNYVSYGDCATILLNQELHIGLIYVVKL